MGPVAGELLPGAMVGRYIVVSLLGAGATGVVYAAFDPELSRQVALKVLHARADDVGGHDVRLQREAQAMARLTHRNTVAVYDVGVADGAVYLAMELVRGSNLRQWLSQRPRTLAEIVEVFAAAAAGLWAAHREGLIHRDFEPETVLVGGDVGGSGPAGRVCVDFGLAAPASSRGAPGTAASSGHAGDDADAGVDQYAWCVALHEAIYGRRPFAGGDLEEIERAKKSGIGDLARRGAPPLRQRVPAWLRAILRRGLGPDRGERFVDMGEVIAALERGRARPRRLMGLAGGAAVAGLVTALSLRDGAPTPCPEPTPPGWERFDRAAISEAFELARPDYGAALAPWVVEGIVDVRDRWRAAHTDICAATWVRGEQSAERLDVRMACLRRGWDRIAAITEAAMTADAAVVAHAEALVGDLPDPDLCRDLAVAVAPGDAARLPLTRTVEQGLAQVHVHRRAERDGEAIAALDRLDPLVEELGDPVLRIETLLLRGRMLDDGGEPARALAALHEAAVLSKSIDAPLHEAEAWIALANAVGYTAHDYDEGRFYGGLAVAAIERGNGGEQLRSWAETALGTIEFVAGQDERAEALWRAALARRRAVLPASHHLIAASLNNLGGVAYGRRDYAGAGELLEQARTMRASLFGPDHPSVADSAINLALVRVAQGRVDEAVALGEHALEVQRSALGPHHPNVGRAHDALAGALEAAGRHADALGHAEQAIAIYTEAWGADHPAGHAVGLHRARALLGLGRVADATAALEALVAALEGPIGDVELRAEAQAELAAARARPR